MLKHWSIVKYNERRASQPKLSNMRLARNRMFSLEICFCVPFLFSFSFYWEIVHSIYLIRKDACQIIHRCYSNSSLVLGRQALHYVFHGYRVLLGGRWLSHESRRIWRETECIHLREVNSCMLTGARKNDDVQQVGKLFNARNWWREAMICLSFTDWIAIVMKIQDPRLQLCILYVI